VLSKRAFSAPAWLFVGDEGFERATEEDARDLFAVMSLLTCDDRNGDGVFCRRGGAIRLEGCDVFGGPGD